MPFFTTRMKFLDKLKRKPKHVRQQIALWVSTSITALIFVMWWTNFTAATSDSSQATLSEALSPVSALAGMAHSAVSGAGSLSNDIKAKVIAIQYEASSTGGQAAATATSDIDGHTPSTQDVVYPEQIFKDPPLGTKEMEHTPTTTKAKQTTN